MMSTLGQSLKTTQVGRTRRGLVPFFDPTHEHLVARIPGIAGMRDKFK
jgi:hypothetical protein